MLSPLKINESFFKKKQHEKYIYISKFTEKAFKLSHRLVFFLTKYYKREHLPIGAIRFKHSTALLREALNMISPIQAFIAIRKLAGHLA